jgi:hypothetical protein
MADSTPGLSPVSAAFPSVAAGCSSAEAKPAKMIHIMAHSANVLRIILIPP